MIGTSEEIGITDAGLMNGIGEVLFAEHGIANIISAAKLINDGYHITWYTAMDDAIFVHTHDGRILKFERSENELYFHNTKDRQIAMMNSQYENSLLCTKWQVQHVHEA